jgi:hypothetical protein
MKLLQFVAVFAGRRRDFEFALAIHTAVGVDEANSKLATISERVKAMEQLFREFVTPQQESLATMVEQLGGDSALKDESKMRKLASAEYALTTHSHIANEQVEEEPAGAGIRHGRGRPFNFFELCQEIQDVPDNAIEKNAEVFNHKFDIQRRQIMDEIARTVSREGDRIISSVTAGPHDRIFDKVWQKSPTFA